MTKKRIAIIAGIVLVVLVAVVMVVPMLIPAEVYRQRIEAEASRALGREVKVTGNVSVSVFPRIEARAGLSTVANPEEFGDAPFATMRELRGAVALWPLLFQQVEIDEFVLVEPNIALIQLEDGRNNWTFQPPATEPAPEPRPRPQPQPQPQPPPSSRAPASLGDVRIIDGHVSFDDRRAGVVHTFAELDLRANMEAINKPFTIQAKGLANDLPFRLNTRIENPKSLIDGLASPITVKVDTELLKTDLDGTLALGESPTFDFAFEGEIPSAVELADALHVKDLPARAVLGKLSASGQAFGSPSDITLKIADARHESPLLNADLKGEARLAEFITLGLDANAEAPKLADLASAMNIEGPAHEALGKATVTARIDGRLGDITFSRVNFNHDSGLLKMGFTGGAQLRANLTFDGRLNIAAPDLRRLASAAGAKLPDGDIYRSFSLTGDTSGGSKDVLLTNATVQFDAIRATGEAGLTFGARPRLTGSLATGDIDVTPYLKASGAPPETQKARGWEDDPIDLSPLRLADAFLTLTADGIRYDKFDFGPSNVAVSLNGGRLFADLKQTSLFGGKGAAAFSVDGGGAIPAISVKANLDGLALKPFLVAAAGFDRIEGSGDVTLDIAGSGSTVRALMNSLAGSGKFSFDEGLIRGVNISQLAAAAQTALSTKSLPVSAFGDKAQTRFGALNASFAMKEGVAVMADLKMNADAFTVTGGGSLDVGDQELSLSLFPEFKSKSSGLNGLGLPVKISGGWNSVKVSLDWDWLARKATAEIEETITSEIEDELQKQLGPELQKLLGLGQKQAASSPAEPAASPGAAPPPPPANPQQPQEPPAADPPPAGAPEQPASEAPKSAEDRLREEAEKALGRLFGND